MEDHLYRFLKLYKKSPQVVKRAVGGCYGLLPYRLRYGNKYEEFRKLVRESRTWTIERHQCYQFAVLKKLITHAYHHVPIYRSKYSAAGVTPEDMQSLEDIQNYPTINRRELKADLNACLAENMPRAAGNRTSTSGSTGDPLVMYHEKGVTRPKERAFLQGLFECFGQREGDKTVIFRGEVIADDNRPWYYDPIDRHLIMSSYRLNENTIEDYCAAIKRKQPSILRGYPFTIFRLAQLVRTVGCNGLDSIRLVVLESENVYDSHVRIIREVLQCEVCHYYGHTERLIFGGNCPYSDCYHMHPEYGFFEIMGSDGQSVNNGCEGEIVATGFDNFLMPLIRYHTGDIGISGGYRQCQCGCSFPVITHVKGREEEYVILRSGVRVPFHNLIAGIHDRTWERLDALQCVQKNPGDLTLKLVAANDWLHEHVSASLLSEIFARIGREELNISVELSNGNDFEKTRNGKTRLFVQKYS